MTFTAAAFSFALALPLIVGCGSTTATTQPGTAGTGGTSTGAAGSAGNTGVAGAGAAGETGTAGSGAAGTTGTAGSGSGGNSGVTGAEVAGHSGTAGIPGGQAGSTGSAGSVGGNGTTLMGSATGSPFATVGSVFWVGAPDVAASTVVYVFSKTVKCADISMSGWDTTIPDKTQILELKMMGTAPATYQPIIKAPKFPAAGEAQVNYTLSTQTGVPAEAFSTSGSVTLTKVTAGTNVTGSFDLTFGANTLKGTYSATYCAVGREP